MYLKGEIQILEMQILTNSQLKCLTSCKILTAGVLAPGPALFFLFGLFYYRLL